MKYELYKNKSSRTHVEKIIIKQDWCGNSFGNSPCTATGTHCYNTFPSCIDRGNYEKTIKDYVHYKGDISNKLKAKLAPARPDLKQIGDIPTEIKETDTITRRVKLLFNDAPDKVDTYTDPYRKERSVIQGTYWKKWIARNSNYKGRIVEYWDAFAYKDDLSEFKRKFVGRIENISLGDGTITIEAVGLLKKLSETKYPLESKYSLAEEVPNIHICNSESDMLDLSAEVGDFAERTDFSIVEIDDSKDQAGNMEETGFYIWEIAAYDSQGRVLAKSDIDGQYTYYVDSQYINSGHSHYVSWNAVLNASYYKLFYRENDSSVWQCSGPLTIRNYTIDSMLADLEEAPPSNAERLFQYIYDTDSISKKWEAFYGELKIKISSSENDLGEEGYIKLGKEIIYFNGNANGYLGNNKRHQYDTESDRHSLYTKLNYIFWMKKDNPFTILKLINSRMDFAEYESSKFSEYESAWNGIKASCKPIIKDTKLNIIYFDLVNAFNCLVWEAEDGTVEIVERDERPSTYKKVTDLFSVFEGSGSPDLNETARKTRQIIYWDKWDVEASADDSNAYNFAWSNINYEKEQPNDGDEILEDPQYTIWINSDCGTWAEITSHLTNLLNSKAARTKEAPKLFPCDHEVKDIDINVGEIVRITTNAFQNMDGTPYTDVPFRVIKKARKDSNKFSFKYIEENEIESEIISEE